MPAPGKSPLPTNFPEPSYLTLTNWKRGVISLIDKSRLPKDALDEAENVYLVEDGQPSPRPGVGWFGTDLGAEIDGFDYFDFAGAVHLVAAAGGKIYRSTDDGQTWEECTGATYTAGSKVHMNQYNAFLYITNGIENITLYDGTTTLLTLTGLATPAAPTFVETGLTGTGEQYWYMCAAVNNIGYSQASVRSAKLETNLSRSNWSATNLATLTLPAFVTGQIRYDIYISEKDSTDPDDFYYLDSTTNTTYIDDGTAVVNATATAPSSSTAQGPKVTELVNVGSRMYGVGDTDYPYRIWFSSGQIPYGSFAPGTGGSYLEWQVGGKYRPVHVEDYRDGKGTPVATVWMNSADGQGAIAQMTLENVDISGYSVTVPSAYKLPGSRGTPASGSVVNVLNDYFFYNSQAIYNLGTRAQFLNLLSTDEASANIRPTVKQITASAEGGIASVYFDAKVLFSVPRGSTTNNYTMMFDTERKAWIPSAFTIGFSKFLKYTTTDKVQKLLCIKPGDSQLSEISSGIQGDYGLPFTVSITTGLYPTTKNRAEFQFTEQAEIELSQPQGVINIELLGTERSKGFKSNKSATIAPKVTPYGWDSLLWDTTLWDDTTNVGDTFSESSVWRYFTIQKELRNIQWRITSNSLDAYFILRTLQTWGTNTQSGFPRQERLN